MYTQQESTIGLDNALVSKKRKAILWTTDGLVYRRKFASLSFDGLKLLDCSIS